ncbi:MAG: sugar transferase [Muribaculaceae bacterium]|nr:sugar transferase [Muribaculaceae bacterium]
MKGRLISIRSMRMRYVIIDLITSALAFFVFNQARYLLMELNELGYTLREYLTTPKMLTEQIVIPFVMLGIYWLSGYYNHPFGKSRLQEFSQTLGSALINTLWIYLALLINDQLPTRYLSYELLFILFGSLFLLTYIGRFCLTQTSISNLTKRRWGFNTVIIGDSPEALAMARRLDSTRTKLGYNIIGYIPIEGEVSSTDNHSTLSAGRLKTLCSTGKVDQLIIVAADGAPDKKILSLLHTYFPLGVPIRIRPSAMDFLTSNIRTGDIYAEPFIDLSSPAMSDSQINIKRVIDISLSTLALIITSPLLLAIAIGVKLTSKGPVLYRQERIGYRQKPFNILKFRSMKIDAEAAGPQLSSDSDPRITPLGRILRKYRLDELPQFWNVIKGEMSLVGPRPERAYYIEKIVKYAPHYSLLHQVKPGITSWGMVKYGYAREVSEMVERSNYDLIYLSNMSVAVDFKILLHTISTVVHGRGI